ncbi:hypothetical protein CROQUDRAFT_101439 [Cronartium quercuum f. sp. fusiforme G11]|uniref:Uncharacterized protein n=1 Tax=Cronartium quercuum f. sp. fusiforme G11 TaxID=708437 RepID=A0A9P6N8X4_9BASI|nr:hypothetical protein CROQUDRAFT_101439 [Cronartium quercuum f. sp. fusiforme G11]
MANLIASQDTNNNPKIGDKQQADTIFNCGDTLGDMLNSHLTPNSVPPSVISLPALPPQSQALEDTILMNQFLADDINLQSNFNNYLPTTNIQQNVTKNQGPLPNNKEVHETHQLP